MANADHIAAHIHSIFHREEIETSDTCGCFNCMQVYPPSEIDEWIDEPDPPGVTALCPKCGIDSVIGSASGYPITSKFLWRMKLRWFYGINTLGEVTGPI